jgi:hypothetical protein
MHQSGGAVECVPGLGQLTEDELLAMLDHDQSFEMDDDDGDDLEVERHAFLDEFDEPVPVPSTSTSTSSSAPAPSSANPLAARLGLSTGDKAGMQSVDKEKANKIIYDMSKVHPFARTLFKQIILVFILLFFLIRNYTVILN